MRKEEANGKLNGVQKGHAEKRPIKTRTQINDKTFGSSTENSSHLKDGLGNLLWLVAQTIN